MRFVRELRRAVRRMRVQGRAVRHAEGSGALQGVRRPVASVLSFLCELGSIFTWAV